MRGGDNDRLAGFVFYPQDYFGDSLVRLMPPDQRLVWNEMFFLMSESPRRGVLLKKNGAPYTAAELAPILNCSIELIEMTQRHVIAEKIASVDRKTGALINRRMVRDEIKRIACTKAGHKGWKAKSDKMVKSQQLPLTLEPRLSLKPEPEPNPEPEHKNPIQVQTVDRASPYSPDFETFWAAVPPHRRVAKGAAWRAWKNNPHPPVAVLVEKIEQAKRSEDWRKDRGRWVPRPATWLNGHGWNDEYVAGNNGADGSRASVEELHRMAEQDFGPLPKKGKERK